MKPILVIADDLTGAAEIGGVALRHGLSAQIVHTLERKVEADVVILNSNSRSMKIDQALSHLAAVLPGHATSGWDWIYLKFDSALRGHIKEEIPFFRSAFGGQQVFFCPANPRLGRLIKDGRYMINDIPIAETDFANDPEFPIRKSDVMEAIGVRNWRLLKKDEKPGQHDVYLVPTVSNEEELEYWARTLPSGSLFAGGAAFFESLLNRHRKVINKQGQLDIEPTGYPKLYVCGSKHESSVERVRRLDQEDVVYWHKPGDEWRLGEELFSVLERKDSAVFAIDPVLETQAVVIRKSMAMSIAILYERCALAELIIEGGATARAVLKALKIDNLRPVKEWAPGVITCRLPEKGSLLTLKPGSYPWTKELWVF